MPKEQQEFANTHFELSALVDRLKNSVAAKGQGEIRWGAIAEMNMIKKEVLQILVMMELDESPTDDEELVAEFVLDSACADFEG
jgi:hypothetical protein